MNNNEKKSFFDYFTEVLGWLQIVASPVLVGLIVGFLIYISERNNTRLMIGIAVAGVHLVVGIIWATRVWRKQGTINFVSRISATPELDISKVACPCCGYKTISYDPNGSYEICPICFWEDDPIQRDDPDYKEGANPLSLRQSQQNFLQIGACDEGMLSYVRPPAPDEQRDGDWKPLDK